MTKNEIQDLILWCKKNKVKSFSQGDLAFEISEIAFVEEIEQKVEESPNVAVDTSTLADTEQTTPNEDEELLFWSSQG